MRAAGLRMRTGRNVAACAGVAFVLAVLASACNSETSPDAVGGSTSTVPSTSNPSPSRTTSTSGAILSVPSIASTEAVATQTSPPDEPPETAASPPTTEPAEVAPTTLRSDPVNLVPPADPSPLIGAVLSAAEQSATPDPNGLLPPNLINGSATSLASSGGACITDECDFAVELHGDRAAFDDDAWPTAIYLTLNQLIDRDPSGRPIWSIVDVVTIEFIPNGRAVSVTTEGCTLPDFPVGHTPVATLLDWQSSPIVPMRMWAADAGFSTLSEVAVDPRWFCYPPGE